MLKIRLSDLRDDGLYILAGKTQDSTGQAMVFTYTQRLRAMLHRAKKLRRRTSSMYLVATRDGTPHSVSGFHSAWRRLKKKCGMGDVHFHDIAV